MLKKQYWKLLVLLASISYPFLVHYLVVTEQYLFAGVYVIALLLMIALQNFLQNYKWLAIGLLLLSLLIGAVLIYKTQLVVFLPPVLIPLALAYVFGKTLMSGQTAFITSIAQKIRTTPLVEKEKKYTRFVTYMWVLFFLFLSIESMLVAFFYDMETWSYITNFLNYILVVLFVMFEYLLRRMVLQNLEHPGFISFIKQLINVQRSR